MRRTQDIFRTGRFQWSFLAAGLLLFSHTFHPDRLSSLSSPLSHVVGAPYQLLQPSIFSQAKSFPFPPHWPLQTLPPPNSITDFGKRAGVSVSLVLAVEVIKGHMKRDKGTELSWQR